VLVESEYHRFIFYVNISFQQKRKRKKLLHIFSHHIPSQDFLCKYTIENHQAVMGAMVVAVAIQKSTLSLSLSTYNDNMVMMN
jgi:hypothetical protein